MKTRFLSLIIPAYKQEKTIYRDLKNIDKVLSKSLKDYKYEVICVVDGEVDSTYYEAKRASSSKIKVVSYKNNKGKGYAVRLGMSLSQGNLISFLDAGMEISPASVTMLMAHLDWYNADIIVGSKRHPVSRVNYPFLRHVLSFGYHAVVQLLFGLPLNDTQSGIKIFKRRVVKTVLPKLIVERYAMDIEMLAVANHLGFKRIFEAPIEVTFDRKTSSISWKVVLKMLWDTLAIFYRLNINGYYNKTSEARGGYSKILKASNIFEKS